MLCNKIPAALQIFFEERAIGYPQISDTVFDHKHTWIHFRDDQTRKSSQCYCYYSLVRSLFSVLYGEWWSRTNLKVLCIFESRCFELSINLFNKSNTMEVDLGSSLTADLEVINNSTKCPIQLPSVPEFVGAMSVEIMGMVAVAGITSIYICLGYYRNLAEMIRRTPKQFLSRTLILCGVYQIVAASSLVSMLVPRAVLICDTVSHFAFIFCAYQITCLFIDYVGGESNFIKQADDQGFHLRTPPCCCCCFCCVPSPITKRKFTFIRLLIIQFLFVQGIVFIALNIIYVESVVRCFEY